MVRRVVAVLGFLVAAGSARAGSFVTFETGQVRPLALSPDDTHLYALNTPDDRLEIFDVDPQWNLAHSGSVPVGLQPVHSPSHGVRRRVGAAPQPTRRRPMQSGCSNP